MFNLVKDFLRDEEGGADQLIVAALMIVAGIGIAIFFGEEIGKFVKKLTTNIRGTEVNSDTFKPVSE